MITFRKETNFKEMRKGRIPKEWDVKRLGEIAQDGGIYYGLTAKAIQKETEFRMLRTTDIKDYATDWVALPFCQITEKRNNLSRFFLRKGDLVVARAGTTGVSVLVERDLENVIFGSYLIKIKLKSDIYPKFIQYFFQSKFYWDHITSGQAGSTLKNINLPILRSIEIPLPPLPEQQKIAEVLSTVDEAIQQTSEVIAKTERLKKGLMQELLTNGIGHREFKDTEIGRIPKEWETAKLSELSGPITKGTTPTTYGFKYTASGVNFIKVESIDEHGGFIPENMPHISQEANKAFSRSILRENDILFSIAGALGRVALVTSGVLPANTNQALAIIRNKEKNRVLTEYLKYFLMGPYIQNFVKSIAIQSQQANLNLEQVRKFLVGLPSIAEQRRIAENLTTVDKKLQLERNEKVKLERIKQGMMDLLLTGKVRIR